MLNSLITFENVTIAWAFILVFSVFMYVFLDGLDLGIGILFPFAKNKHYRDQMMNSVAPVWDGNETWLIMGGIALFCAFPVVYSGFLPSVYVPLILMLLGLIMRGVAFEFRFKSRAVRGRRIWNTAFGLGSILATFCQGIILGSYIHGTNIVDGQFVGGPFDCFHGFSFIISLTLIVTYALLAACWLIRKTEGEIREWAIWLGRILLPLMLLGLIFLSLWAPFTDPIIFNRWFTAPTMYFAMIIPVLMLLTIVGLHRCLYKNPDVDRRPFQLMILLIILGFIGLAISFWPYAIPKTISVWEAASPLGTQLFALIGIIIMMPIVLTYTAFTYFVFRGKVSENLTYHE